MLAPLGYRNVTTAFGPVTTMPGSLYGRYETRDYETVATAPAFTVLVLAYAFAAITDAGR